MSVVEDLIDEAYRIAEEQDELKERRSAIRSTLRDFAKTGVATEEQQEQIDELFPPITRTRKAS